MARPDALLEREELLARADDLLADAGAGHGRLLVLEGPAGIGKTVLLRAICERAGDFVVLRARGGELEQAFPHAIVRQLFEMHLRELPDETRARMLSGAAEQAAPVVAAGVGSGAVDTSFAVTHGLYWLTANLTDEQPLVLAVDDTHWADRASLRFLLHLVRRLEGLRVLVAVAVRSGEPGAPADLLADLAAEGDTARLEPLSAAAVAEIVGATLGEPEPEFAAACHQATGGIPYLLRELLAALEGRPPTAASIEHVEQTGPQAVARGVLARLRRLPEATAELARAIAVLGTDGQLHRAARLAGISPDDAVAAADALIAMDILRERMPPDFVHPIVRSAIYGAIPAAARGAAHLRAAEVLEKDGADADAVAGHLVLTEPGARSGTAARLRETARRALARGAPESAATYLRRALQEAMTRRERTETLLELGRAQRLIDLPSARDPLREAYASTEDRDLRARIAYELIDTNYYFGSWGESNDLLDAALEHADELELDLAVRLEAVRTAHDLYIADRAPAAFGRLPELIAAASADTPAGRMMALMLAGNAGWLAQPAELIWSLLEHGLAGGRFLEEEGADSWVAPYAVQAAALTDDLDRATDVLELFLADARRRASIRGYATAISHRGWMSARRGDLAAGEADLRAVLEILPLASGRGGLADAAMWAMTMDVVLERTGMTDVLHTLARKEIEPQLDGVIWGMHARETRGRARLALGDTAGAVADLRACNHPVFARGAQPNYWTWRGLLALAMGASEPEEARELAARDLKMAARSGRPRGLAVAHRTIGLLEGSLEHLEESVRQAEASPSRLEHARSLVELGAALRRANRRADARERLREGLDLAYRCGAQRLSERTRAELAATGARPRREVLTGADALTATERRIADMAARGMSNPDIAQALFVTRKTVENHLARIYGKLGINSRTQLSEALHR